jgi:phosphoribosylanthranilate isomerase
MWVKICANANLEDAALAAQFGADAVGFVFAPSKRQVTVHQVASIVSDLPDGIEKIGVFTSRDANEIVETVRATGLTGIQLHGGLNLELARQFKSILGEQTAVIQTLHWQVGGDDRQAAEFAAQLETVAREPAIDRVLVDSKLGNAVGGTGVRFDWNAARAVFANAKSKLILAGGLRPENVAEAIAILHPWGVDVASGVEDFPGKKDQMKLRSFIENARSSVRAVDPV